MNNSSKETLLFDLTLTDEQRMNRETIQRFAEAEIRANAKDADEAGSTPDSFYQQAAALGAQLKALGGILGVLQQHPQEYLQGGDDSALDDAWIDALIQRRGDAKAEKNWDEADRIRDELGPRGVVLEDGPGGTTWRRVS